MKNNEQLRECVNSGQVSAAQVVAHAEAGELSAIDRVTEAALRQIADIGKALAAERAEVARLKKALDIAERYVALQNAPWSHTVQSDDLKEVRAALNPNQGATNHD